MSAFSQRRTNLKPSFWGPSAWKFLYTVALGYPVDPTEEGKQAAANLLEGLHHLLPCSNCRENVNKELQNSPIDNGLRNQKEFTHYVYMLEKSVSNRLGKPFPTFDERLREIYSAPDYRQPAARADIRQAGTPTKLTESCSSLSTTYWVLILISVAIVVAVATWAATYYPTKHNCVKKASTT